MVKDKLQKNTCSLESNIHIYKYRLNVIKNGGHIKVQLSVAKCWLVHFKQVTEVSLKSWSPKTSLACTEISLSLTIA